MKQTIQHVLVKLLAILISVQTTDGWNPEDDHPCNIRVVSLDDVNQEFGPKGLPPLYHSPLVIRSGLHRNAVLRSRTSADRIMQQFEPNFNVTLSSSNALSERRRTIPLQRYLDEISAKPETKLTQLANESWYLFGETYTEPWQNLLQAYQLPPCYTCQRDGPYSVALSFGLGNRGSGVQWHTHGPGFSEAIHGHKHWVLYPAANAPPARMHKDQSSRQWMQDEYQRARADAEFYECTRKYRILIVSDGCGTRYHIITS